MNSLSTINACSSVKVIATLTAKGLFRLFFSHLRNKPAVGKPPQNDSDLNKLQLIFLKKIFYTNRLLAFVGILVALENVKFFHC